MPSLAKGPVFSEQDNTNLTILPIRTNPADADSRRQLAAFMEAAGDLVFRINKLGKILYASKRTREMLGQSHELVGMPLIELVPAAARAAIESSISQALAATTPVRSSVCLDTRSSMLWLDLQLMAYTHESGELELFVIGRDISAQRAAEERLRHLATHDALTGLPNRSLLSDRLCMAIAQARRSESKFSVLALGLDGFKKVNDALGHEVGDTLLRMAAERLRDTLRDVDTLSRLGGDEFVAVLPGAFEETGIQIIARRLVSAMQSPFYIKEHTLYVGTSIGAVVYPDHGEDEVRLLAHADLAMGRAKQTGRARCVLFSFDQFTRPVHDVTMEAAMFEACRNGDFLLQYQPIVDTQTLQIRGFEALMRWMRPELGMVSPGEFISMAEDNGLINLLGAWALKSACMQLKQFEAAAGRDLYVTVNVSPRQFRNDHFLGMLDDALSLSGLPGTHLLLEITEGILMSDPVHAEALLRQIAERRVRVAIDDFGTGYSSLAYLKRFPISTLKIDRAFIVDLPGSIKDAAICNVVLSLASHLSLTTVAEGVENDEQLQFLRAHGCTLIQGYFTGRPLLPEQVIEMFERESSPVVRPTIHDVHVNEQS
jgi:diguanylate cyclase (GGDEF)-like protein/PAS domain S-box-containing protein